MYHIIFRVKNILRRVYINMNKFVSKSILSSISAVALLMAASPAIDAQENSDQVSESAVKDNQQENIKEVNTYEEFKNSKDPVSINPANLSNGQLEELGLNAQQTKQEFGINENGIQNEATKKWSTKISKSKITGTATTAGGIVSLIGLFVTGGTVTAATGPVISVFTGIAQGSKVKGVKVGGTATKRLVRENPYQLPKKKWVYKATWAKTY